MKKFPEMNVGVYGGGGRDACLAYLYSMDPQIDKVYYFPGTPGLELTRTGREGVIKHIPDVRQVEDVVKFCQEKNICLVDAGSENSLSMGIVDALEEVGIKAVGPRKEYVRIESDRHFTKQLLEKNGIPIADYTLFTNPGEGYGFVEKADRPVVLKANGLASGKGCEEFYLPNEGEIGRANLWLEEVMVGVRDNKGKFIKNEDGSLKRRFGSSGNKVLAESLIEGQEFSYYVYLDGKGYKPLEMLAQDYKNACDDGDRECWERFKNAQKSGGFGAYCPHAMFTPELNRKILRELVDPTVNAIYNDLGWNYRGVLYFGGTIDPKGDIYDFEINVRHGDPEWEVIGPKLATSLFDISRATVDGGLDQLKIEWNDNYLCDVVAAVGRSSRGKGKGWHPGYPMSCGEGYKIIMPEGIFDDEKVLVFFAGVMNHPERELATKGGRVLHAVGRGPTIEEARDTAYKWTGGIEFLDHKNPDESGRGRNVMRYRKTIGL